MKRRNPVLRSAVEQAAALGVPGAAGGAPRADSLQILLYEADSLSRRALHNRLLILGARVNAGRDRAHFLELLEQGRADVPPFDLVTAVFSRTEVTSGARERLLQAVRARTPAPVLVLSPSEPLGRPGDLAEDPRILWRSRAQCRHEDPPDPRPGERCAGSGGSSPAASSGRWHPASDPAFQRKLEAALAEEIRGVASAARGGDWLRVAERAHRLNGLAAYAGREELRMRARAVEHSACLDDRPDLQDQLDRLLAWAALGQSQPPD